ncbi:MAG: YceI family protein [Anaerolineae bacterium]|nr:YceI family protein [Thermoflexales bacterium]MDW8407577.1 YceI family protein [Anaerolineae bacterium]
MTHAKAQRIPTIAALAGALLLSACGGAATPAPTATTLPPTPTTAPTVASTESTAPTEATATPQPAAGGASVVTLKIVPEESKASYAVDETFLNQNNRLVTAVGVTTIVNGAITLDTQNPANTQVGEITVDISALKSDSDRRDNAIRRNWLESANYPIAKFVPKSYEGLPSSYEIGQELTFKMSGDMTVRDTTISVTWDVVARYDGKQLSGTATTQIKMSSFNFDPPSIAGILRAEDDAKLTLEFVAR